MYFSYQRVLWLCVLIHNIWVLSLPSTTWAASIGNIPQTNGLFVYIGWRTCWLINIFFKGLLLLWPGQRWIFLCVCNCFLIKISNRCQEIFHTNTWRMMPLATNIQQCYCSDYFPHSREDDEGNETTTGGGYTENAGPIREQWLTGKCHNTSHCC